MQTIIRQLRESLLSALSPTSHLPLYDEREVRSIIDLLLEEVCGLSRVERLLHPETSPTSAQRQELQRCALLLAQGMPVQQALGYEWFCGQKFHVTPDVLIPRPETAELVDWIVQTLQPSASSHPTTAPGTVRESDVSIPTSACSHPATAPYRILDLGTGSGCIAISLARLINNSQVIGADLSTAALSVARCNAYEQHVDNIQFVQFDILNGEDNSYFHRVIIRLLTDDNLVSDRDNQQESTAGNQPQACTFQRPDTNETTLINHKFNLIVSNPPYICHREANEMSSLVLDHEPGIALFVPDDDPLLFYRTIARIARRHLTPQGFLFFEINAAYGPETYQMLHDEGFAQVELRQDVNGRDRMIRASLM